LLIGLHKFLAKYYHPTQKKASTGCEELKIRVIVVKASQLMRNSLKTQNNFCNNCHDFRNWVRKWINKFILNRSNI